MYFTNTADKYVFLSYISKCQARQRRAKWERKREREKKTQEHQAKSIPSASSMRLKEGFPGNASDWLIYMDIKGSTGERV